MCQTLAEGGRRCSSVSVYSREVRNIQARKQYYLRKAAQTTSTVERTILEKKAEQQKTNLDDFVHAHEHYGYVGMRSFEMPVTPEVEKALNRLRTDGMEPLIVGGSVRDSFLGLPSKDMDIEVYGAPVEEVVKSLSKLGHVDEVGKAFGVLKIRLGDEDLDVSLPRTDSKSGDGHRGFEIAVDPFMKPHKAAERRDFTINAMLYDHKRKVLLDPYNGVEDLNNKKLKHVSDAFDEDPLRVLRGVQMASRFGMEIDPDTVEKAKTLKSGFEDLATERVQMEFNKMFTKGKDTPKAFQALKATEWDNNFPGLSEVNNPKLWNNLKRVDSSSLSGEKKISLMSAICITDMSKKDAEKFLRKTVTRDDTRATARRLYEITPPTKQGVTEMKRWAQEIGNATNIREWCQYQNLLGNDKEAESIFKKAEKIGILDRPEADLLLGRDVLDMFPERKPGRWLGDLLREARARQEEGAYRTKETALAWLKTNMPKES